MAPRLWEQPVFGLPVEVPDPAGRSLAVFFVPSLVTPVGRETVARVQAALPALEARGARVLAITRSGLGMARDFVPRHHVLFPIVVDPVGHHFLAFGVGEDRDFTSTLASLARVGPRDLLACLRQGIRLPDGPWRQLGGEYVLDGRGCVLWGRVHRSVFDLPDFPAMMAIVAPEIGRR